MGMTGKNWIHEVNSAGVIIEVVTDVAVAGYEVLVLAIGMSSTAMTECRSHWLHGGWRWLLWAAERWFLLVCGVGLLCRAEDETADVGETLRLVRFLREFERVCYSGSRFFLSSRRVRSF